MDENQYHNFIYNLSRIESRLDKIIELLELRNSIEVARDEMRQAADVACTCQQNKAGSTGGWICPVHGQRF